jgi:2'-5' RNA ligase
MEWGLSEHGFERETRAFHPHFTLGRVQSESGAGEFRGLDTLSAELSYASTVNVHRLDIMESHLSASGPLYEVVTSFPLKGPPGR